MEKTYYVYKHTFPNKKIYIGITSQRPEYRWQKDGGGYRKKIKGEYMQPLMARATMKYSWDDIKHEILYEGLSKEEAEQKEIELISFYRSNERAYGYNINDGGHISSGMKGRHLSEETKKKISESLKMENSPMYGKHLSEETKKKIGDAKRGVKMSENARKNMSESHKGKPFLKKRKQIICIETGIIYDSITNAESLLNIEHISDCCCGKRNIAGGYHWCFLEEYDKDAYIVKKPKTTNKPKMVMCIETSVVYESLKDAERKTGIKSSGISRVCNGEVKTAGGYHWKFVC